MAVIKVSTVIKTVSSRAWHDIEPKLLAFLATGLSAGIVVEAGDYVGIHVSPALAVVISTCVASIAGYFKSSTNKIVTPQDEPIVQGPTA